MAALGALMRGVLPPAGDAVVLRPRDGEPEVLLRRWLPYRPYYYASGTAALAAALTAVVRRAGRPRPQVILPGYGCPALVSAVLHAGAAPVYVDLEPERPWLSLAALREAIGADTVAVVAVNLLGIPERLRRLRELIAGTGIALVSDSAQALPLAAPADADAVVLSFGRGKPVSLLGGGALLVRDAALAVALPQPAAEAASFWPLRAKAAAYNLLRRPYCYWLPSLLPLGLGATRFQPLSRIGPMTAPAIRALPAAAEAYAARRKTVQAQLRERIAALADDRVLDLALACGLGREADLLRYPLLARDPATRGSLLRRLASRGLGASPMYGAALPRVAGMPAATRRASLPAAQDFAERFFTLPVHDLVAPRHVEAMAEVLGAGAGGELPRESEEIP